jgi:DNA-binding MarR family transcriptional regulator
LANYRRTRTTLATNSQQVHTYDPTVDPFERRDADLLQELFSTGLLVGLLVDEELARIGVPQNLFSFIGWVTMLQPVTPGGLVAETGLPPTTVRDYIRRLVERGDVRKLPNPHDGRSYFLVLTAKGQRIADRGWPAVVAAYARIEANLERPAAEYLDGSRELREAVKRALADSRRPERGNRRASAGDSGAGALAPVRGA